MTAKKAKEPLQPQSRAVALRYDQDALAAPQVVAKGCGLLAEKIRAIARQHGIPLYEDADLVEMLSQVDIDREIPVELYGAVAEVLSWVYRANEFMKRENG
jgi:flagellar biosynthesis protein